VEVHGRPIPGRGVLRYFVLNKPVGVLTTMSDPEGRRTVRDLLPPGPRLFPVGRLDADTSGLLLLTNDGELAHHLMHPRYGVSKVYRARLDTAPTGEQLRRLREGVAFGPGEVSGPAEVRLRSTRPEGSDLEITIREGRYRQVRRMCESVGLRVRALHRVAYGPLRLAGIARGAWRPLSPPEVRRLRAEAARPSGAVRPAVRYPGSPRPPGSARSARASSSPRPPARPSGSARRARASSSFRSPARVGRPTGRTPGSPWRSTRASAQGPAGRSRPGPASRMAKPRRGNRTRSKG
jgi:23S rRNA pseudouridine2605 synthase